MISNKKIISITLARGGSKRIPRKNLEKIEGIPLIQYTINEIKKSKYIDKSIISSDDDEILKIAKESNVEIHKRSHKNSQDTSTSADAIKEVLQSIHEKFDIIVEVMCTNPLKTVEDVDACIEKISDMKSDSVVSVVRVWDNHPSRLKYIENDVLCDFYPEIPESRRQDLFPPAYVRNGSIYAFTFESFINNGTRIGKTCRPYIMPPERSINIDEKIDLEIAKCMIRNRK